MTRKFPTPAQVRAKREAVAKAATEAEIDDALSAVESALVSGLRAVTWQWNRAARAPVEQALRDAGWQTQFTSDREDSTLVILPDEPVPMGDLCDARWKR